MSQEIIKNYSNAVWNKKEISAVDSLFNAETLIHSPLRQLKGAGAMKEIAIAWLQAFPNLHVSHEGFVCENDMVVSHWSAKGTHQGEFQGIQATEKPVSYSGASMYRMKSGKIIEYWAFVNLHHIMEQITDDKKN